MLSEVYCTGRVIDASVLVANGFQAGFHKTLNTAGCIIALTIIPVSQVNKAHSINQRKQGDKLMP